MRTRVIRSCGVCGNKYSKKEHYERHLRVHTRERPFACSDCSATFSRHDSLQRHRRARHPGSDLKSPHVDNASSSVNEASQPQQTNTSEHLAAPNVSLTGDVAPSLILDPSQTNIHMAIPSETFDWQWDNGLNLDPSFSMEALGVSESDFAFLGTFGAPFRAPEPSLTQAQLQLISPREGNTDTQILTPVESRGSSGIAADVSEFAVDENSRDVLARSLRRRIPDTTLPSTEFLNRCIYLYTTRLWPLIPVVHLPTFQPARTHPLLLLNICALGALADGSEGAYRHAVRLFEGVRKAILVALPLDHAQPDELLAVQQASVIGQTCVILAGQDAHFRTARSFHAAIGVLLQDFQKLVAESPSYPRTVGGSCASADSNSDWHQWIRRQTVVRLLNAVQVHNGELAAITHQVAQLRTPASQLVAADPDSLFLAKTSDEWFSLTASLAASSERPTAMFSSCAKLEHIIAEIGHSKFLRSDDAVAQNRLDLELSLSRWLKKQSSSLLSERSHRLSPMLLWHSCFLLLTCDLDLMERTYSPDDGYLPARQIDSDQAMSSLADWVLTKDAARAVIHASLIARSLERFRVSEAPAIHAARCVWHAGLVLTVHSLFCGDRDDRPRELQEYPELLQAQQSGVLTEADWDAVRQPLFKDQSRTLAYTLCTTLRCLGPWGNAAYFANKLSKALDSSNWMPSR